MPRSIARAWQTLSDGYARITDAAKGVRHDRALQQLGTLGSGNHFIEVCLDEADRVWVMLHSGSRGPGNRIGTHFIHLARREMEREQVRLPDRDLAWLREGSELFDDYVAAVGWAQDYALANRELMKRDLLSGFSAGVSATQSGEVPLGRDWVMREIETQTDMPRDFTLLVVKQT